jgi:hypothetical protein
MGGQGSRLVSPHLFTNVVWNMLVCGLIYLFRPGFEAVANGLDKYLDPNDSDDPLMEHAPVTTDDLERPSAHWIT